MTRDEFQNMALTLRPRLLAQCVKLLADDEAAEDVVQDALLKLWTMGERLESYTSVESLARVMCRNMCLDRLRRPATGRSVSLDEVEGLRYASPTALPDKQLTDREALNEVMRLMETLPDSVQTVMRMRHVEGMETEEIASLIGAKVEAVRVTLSRGRRRLKELFDTRTI